MFSLYFYVPVSLQTNKENDKEILIGVIYFKWSKK